MSKTITCHYMGAIEKDAHETTIQYLTKIGMNPWAGADGAALMIEINEVPEIVTSLEAATGSEQIWDVFKISDAGVSLYVTNWQPADGLIFIPTENIIALHTLSSEFIAKTSGFHKAKAGGHNG